MYYQEGNFIRGLVENQTTHVLARYSRTDDVAASLNKYGEGWVGTTGPHPEANQKWFKVANLTSPDGLQFDIGHDLIEATMTGGQNVKSLAAAGSSAISSAVPSPTAKSAGNKIQNPLRRLFRR
ncbi:hypothetical protein NQ176_g10891 [Zarea fungicola]|uniref:Uncharacterized protein n=1 Tax=Zarea fungicola TaxID=93591 RepID=A0ACC1MD37_9HYPO|nr:hypothetical protein NQ176_g10891 [Lecanicillium fungicola]